MTLYPNRDFFGMYSTENPAIAVIGCLCIILVTSTLFFLYDMFVRKEFHKKKVIFQAKRRFVRYVSHEVRTPLNAVCLGLKLLRDELDSFARETATKTECEDPIDKTKLVSSLGNWSEQGEEVLRNAHSAVTVLTDLLHYDKVESKTLKLELAVLPIWQLMENVVAEFRLPAQKKQQKVAMDYSSLFDSVGGMDVESASWTELTVEEKELKVIGSISIRPRWKKNKKKESKPDEFTLHNGDKVRCPWAGTLEVAVVDSGVGMSPEELSSLFGEGIQFNVNVLQAGQGSGLGLYIARGMAVQHGGSLEAASEGLNLGSTFTMTLPVYRIATKDPSSVDPVEVSGTKAENTPVAKFEALRVLVVDDAAMNRKLLVRLLQKEGHSCEEAMDGIVAVEKVREAIDGGRPFDSILMDYEMPRCNGPTAAQAIRAMGCDSFIVGITGNLFPEDVSYFKESGANRVLGKPLAQKDLFDLWAEYGVGRSYDFERRSSGSTHTDSVAEQPPLG
eukprot:scaffold15349_cov89-Amphora_coffeaeformis.AAC.1